MIALSVALVCASCICSQLMHYAFKRELQEHKDVTALAERLEAELEKIDDLKSRIDKLSLKVGMR